MQLRLYNPTVVAFVGNEAALLLTVAIPVAIPLTVAQVVNTIKPFIMFIISLKPSRQDFRGKIRKKRPVNTVDILIIPARNTGTSSQSWLRIG